MYKIDFKIILILSFMIFVMFLGAGNIIIPPILGYKLKTNFFLNVFGFSITSVILPMITIIILTKFKGFVEELSLSIGKINGLILISICYLVIGPLCAVPRTATISFEAIYSNINYNKEILLFLYSFLYFILIIYISLHPEKILNFTGNFLAIIKFITLITLTISTIFFSINIPKNLIENKNYNVPIIKGINNGYLTMDVISALIFGIIIINFAKNNIKINLLTLNILFSSLLAGLSMILVYFSLFKIGIYSINLVKNNLNGVDILKYYTINKFGILGNFFITVLIFITCLITAVSLTCSCANFFSNLTKISYNKLVYILCIIPMIFSNFGLNHLIKFSIPILKIVYIPCIIMIFLSYIFYFYKKYKKFGIWIVLLFLSIKTLYSFLIYWN